MVDRGVTAMAAGGEAGIARAKILPSHSHDFTATAALGIVRLSVCLLPIPLNSAKMMVCLIPPEATRKGT